MSVSDENRPSVANVYPKDGGKLTKKEAVLTREENIPRPLSGKCDGERGKSWS